MKCPVCSAETPADSVYCPRCGQRIDGSAPAEAVEDASDVAPTNHARFSQSVAAAQSRPDDEEADIWEGTYSPKAMIGSWVAAGFLALAAVVLGALLGASAGAWGGIALGILLLWGGLALLLAYRRLSVRYRLTSQRLFHERGLLRRVIDRIENIDMDDITFEQGLFERMLGVGSIRIKSSDRTDPDFCLVGVDQVRDVAAKIDAARRREQVRRSVRIDQV